MAYSKLQSNYRESWRTYHLVSLCLLGFLLLILFTHSTTTPPANQSSNPDSPTPSPSKSENSFLKKWVRKEYNSCIFPSAKPKSLEGNYRILILEPSLHKAHYIQLQLENYFEFSTVEVIANGCENPFEQEPNVLIYSVDTWCNVPELRASYPEASFIGIASKKEFDTETSSDVILCRNSISNTCISNLYTTIGFHLQDLERRKCFEDKLEDTMKAPGTGIGNRRFIDYMIPQAIAKFNEEGGSLYLLLIDIDNFKQFNTKFGHQHGSDVLLQLAGKMEASLLVGWDDEGDSSVSRYGGDEFLITLCCRDTSSESVVEFGEYLLGEISSMGFGQSTNSDEPGVHSVTASIGIAKYNGGTMREFLLRADNALYESKEQGKAQVVLI